MNKCKFPQRPIFTPCGWFQIWCLWTERLVWKLGGCGWCWAWTALWTLGCWCSLLCWSYPSEPPPTHTGTYKWMQPYMSINKNWEMSTAYSLSGKSSYHTGKRKLEPHVSIQIVRRDTWRRRGSWASTYIWHITAGVISHMQTCLQYLGELVGWCLWWCTESAHEVSGWSRPYTTKTRRHDRESVRQTPVRMTESQTMLTVEWIAARVSSSVSLAWYWLSHTGSSIPLVRKTQSSERRFETTDACVESL